MLWRPLQAWGEICGIPHLAKDERDVGHPAIVVGIENKSASLGPEQRSLEQEPQVPPLRFAPVGMTILRSPGVAEGADSLIEEGGFFPVEVAAQDGFDDQMIGGGCGAYSYSDVDLPLG